MPASGAPLGSAPEGPTKSGYQADAHPVFDDTRGEHAGRETQHGTVGADFSDWVGECSRRSIRIPERVSNAAKNPRTAIDRGPRLTTHRASLTA